MKLNDLGEKLVYDGSDKTRLRVHLIGLAIGFCFLFAAGICLALKMLIEHQVNREQFYFLPISAIFMFCGALTFAIIGIRSTYFLFKSQNKGIRRKYLSTVFGCLAMVIGYAALLFFLLAVNSDRTVMPIVIASAGTAGIFLLSAVILGISTLNS